jgi:hypothetical protein
VEQLKIAYMRQHLIGQGIEENPFRLCGPTSTANGLQEFLMVWGAGKRSQGQFHFAQFPLEALDPIAGRRTHRLSHSCHVLSPGMTVRMLLLNGSENKVDFVS